MGKDTLMRSNSTDTVAVLATCSMNQWALDYSGNRDRIIEAILKAKSAGATYLCTPELDIVGYGCGDHYHDRDTERYAWQVLANLLMNPVCADIMVDVGLPVMHKNVIYNCKLVFYNRKVIFIRPKMILANDGSMGYRETRWFTAWTKIREIETYTLPGEIQEITGQTSVPFGDALIKTKDTTIGYEICEELWNPESCHLSQCLDGAEIISNSLGSLEEFGRPGIGYQMVKSATMKSGCCYLFANLKGCDGGRGYFAGDACIGLNGNLVAQTVLHNLKDVNVVTATVDLESIQRYKATIRSRCIHAEKSKPYPRIEVDVQLTNGNCWVTRTPISMPIEPLIPTKDEQILLTTACWLWDYLRRSTQRGLLLPLSGDIDSSATAAIVFSMCHLLMESIKKEDDDKVLADVQRVVGITSYVPSSAKDLCSWLVTTIFVGTHSSNSRQEDIANEISKQIGSSHSVVSLEEIMGNPSFQFLENILNKQIIENYGSEDQEREERQCNASQNFKSRMTMAVVYLVAETTPKLNKESSSSHQELIVLASSDAENRSTGSDVKYGKTFGDINLIGHFPKKDIINFLHMAKERLELPVLGWLNLHLQSDEEANSILHGLKSYGPYSMFKALWCSKGDNFTASQVAESVKQYFRSRSLFRLNTLGSPPSFYMPSIDTPDDVNPMVYPLSWSLPFESVDQRVEMIEQRKLPKCSE